MVFTMTQLDADQAIRASYDDATQSQRVKAISGVLVTDPFDYIALTYVAAGNGTGEIQTVTYKSGGAGGTTVAILTLTYDASNRISTVTKS